MDDSGMCHQACKRFLPQPQPAPDMHRNPVPGWPGHLASGAAGLRMRHHPKMMRHARVRQRIYRRQ